MNEDNAVIIEYRSGPLNGLQFGVVSAEAAKRVHPEAVILRYRDGREYTGAQSPEAAEAVKRELDDHTVKELQAMAAERGVELPPKAKKAEIISALEAAV